jgi:hypothetical protein
VPSLCLEHKPFPNFLELFHYEGPWAWRPVIQWLPVLFLVLLNRVIQKNERKGKGLKSTSLWTNWILLHFRCFYNTGTFTYKSSYVSSCFINANKFSRNYLPFWSLAYPSVLQVTWGPYFIWEIAFVSSCPIPLSVWSVDQWSTSIR